MRTRPIVTTAAALVLAGSGFAGAAGATAHHARPHPAAKAQTHTLIKGLVGPLKLSVALDGTRYVSQNFAGLLTAQKPGGKPTVVYADKQHREVGGVTAYHSTVRFTITGKKTALLMKIGPKGHIVQVADLYAYEKHANPDKGVTYGFEKISKSCAQQLPKQVGPAQYPGQVDSHPYSTLVSHGVTYVADAAGNDIVAVDKQGRISTVAVMPGVAVKVTSSIAKANGLPKCTVGLTYDFESVPTDIERHHGRFYVSSLPGGPEDGSAGAIGGVYKVNPHTGKVTQLASGLISANGLAVNKHGDIFVSQLFLGQISKIKHGTHVAKPFLSVPLPADVDITKHGMFAVVNVLPPNSGPPDGQLVRITH